MKKLDIKRKRIFSFYKVPYNITDEGYTVISDSTIILHITELCKMYNLELLGVRTNGLDRISVELNSNRENFNLFVAEMCRTFINKIGDVEF